MRKQYVTQLPKKEFVEQYTTKSGEVKNRYRTRQDNPVVKMIKHLK
jgi:hypothetical protein